MRAGTRKVYTEKIITALIHIQQNLDEPSSLDELASIACLSKYHFHRIFKGMVGEGVWEHIRRLRLERSAYQLKNTQRPVTRIAFDAGYETHESFSRAFREMFGLAPSQFRKKISAGRFPKSPSGVAYSPNGIIKGFIPLDTGGISMNVVIKNIEPRRVAFIRHTGPYAECGAAWDKLCSWAEPRGLLKKENVYLGLCHDNPEITPPEKVRYDACMTVDEGFEPEGEVGVQVIEGGDYAVTLHEGSFETIKDLYAKLCGQWIPSRGREIRSAPNFEICLNDPNVTAPEDLKIEVYVPLE